MVTVQTETPPSKPSKQFWKTFLSNPKSISSDSLMGNQSEQSDYGMNSSTKLLRRPTITSKNISAPSKSEKTNISSMEGQNQKMNNDANFKSHRDDFILNKHGFTGTVFGTSLENSLRVASAEVIVQNEFVTFGRIPIVVAKSGAYLKANALDVSGIFRISGSNKRVKQLQHIFSTPPDYGLKFTEWDTYTVHDIGTLLRRYLNNLDEPLIPLDLYEKFREPLESKPKLMKYITDMGSQPRLTVKSNDDKPEESIEQKKKEKKRKRKIAKDIKQTILEYQELFSLLSSESRQLTVYLLDLLSLFAKHSEKNLMTGKNLSAIFQPSMLSHPNDDLDPKQYEISRIVLEFLIEFSYKLLPYILKLKTEGQIKHKDSTPETSLTNEQIKNTTSSSFITDNDINKTETENINAIDANGISDKHLLIPRHNDSNRNAKNSHNRKYSKSFSSVANPSDVIDHNKSFTLTSENITDSGENIEDDLDGSSEESNSSIVSSLNNDEAVSLANEPKLHVTNVVINGSPERQGRRSRRSSWFSKLYSRSTSRSNSISMSRSNSHH
ncbi:hypothetical protein TPHA_0E01490 [Tetrapisispora phaffii CBS 4417]|uniref:Rho-GAP domain-containing protein n=1 Tax=Tetrapisispora phaffii (strain ATCC 24235 / CBS 4417 / NBRC 1672 / NRRL Y-8282 / UCD 70-5) TaxID=1071381 RepID=G8BTL5_TETPH|nr:hypothetical protein TPHA_0E01490 [Tetrapisispora phaffii CBS 4417]CCE63243.1 hypothetical protein TPHA_0E01490 [Tetrapisispora phaffii CBS 4417]